MQNFFLAGITSWWRLLEIDCRWSWAEVGLKVGEEEDEEEEEDEGEVEEEVSLFLEW